MEIGFALRPDHWGRGLATEAARFALAQARSRLGLRTLIGIATPENRASRRVLEKIGLRYERDAVVNATP